MSFNPIYPSLLPLPHGKSKRISIIRMTQGKCEMGSEWDAAAAADDDDDDDKRTAA